MAKLKILTVKLPENKKKDYYVKEALYRHLEDIEDYEIAVKSLKSNGKTYRGKEVDKRLEDPRSSQAFRCLPNIREKIWPINKLMTNQELKEQENPQGVNAFDGLICSFCKKAVGEEEMVATRNNKLACENCYDPADPDQQEESFIELEANKEKARESINKNTSQKVSNYQPSLYFTNNNKKTNESLKETSQKVIEINSEELNNRIEIPEELNIVDCPPDIKPDKE
ncbi:4578_t:CDS:2 [Scutellospora calospora]|uniref:4578_t:CDS:1 n=1 Tax=Scutellospora calospora TaxID=85575 RepID=A0ACA9JXI9_9GLOM|nr:4578_t:CDS:2 [Scutellospora calospora]